MTAPRRVLSDGQGGSRSDHATTVSGHDFGYNVWSFDEDPSAAETGPDEATAPSVSLFSPTTVALSQAEPSEHTSDSSAGHTGTASPFVGAGPSRSQPTVGIVPIMQRNARLKISDEQPAPIAPYSPRIPSAQKDVDDPTTPPENKKNKHTRGRAHNTLTSLSRLFAGDATMTTSRAPSYTQATGPLYLRASNNAVPLPDHLYSRGLLEGRHSDITLVAFGQRYNLHRLILDRAPFFTTALSEPWIESHAREVTLHPEEIDTTITQAAFELAIKKLYGVDISKDSDAEAVGLFATGCWLEMQDLIDGSIESILRQMTPDFLAPLIRLVTTNYYGRSGDRILESAKAMISRNGWEMPLKYWDGMPGDIIRELVASDGFYVDSEWDRWVLAKRLLDRRLRVAAIESGLIQRGQTPIPKAPNSSSLLAVRFDGAYRRTVLATQQPASDAQTDWLALYTNPDIERILVLLDEGVHYIHMDYEQLELIRSARDIFGLPVMPDKVISNALWQQLALRQRVLNADDSAQELGLSMHPPEPAAVNAGTKIEGTASANGKQKAVVKNLDTDEDADSESWDGNGKSRKFWIPSSDCNIVLGNGADPVITTSHSFQRHATRLSATIQPEDAQWATDFASSPGTMANPNTRIDHGRPVSAGGGNAGQPKPISCTYYPPFRFSAEFPNPRFLKEKKRVYSRTVSYAGSLWNIYIQKVRSAKNVQLGVYLHRAKERDAEEATNNNSVSQQNAGSVDERIGQLEREMLLRSERRDRRRSGRTPAQDQANEEDTSGSGGDPDSTVASSNLQNPLFSTNSLVSRRIGAIPRFSSVRGNASSQFPTLPGSPPTDGEGHSESPFFPLAIDAVSESASDESDEDDEPAAAYPNPSLANHRKPRSALPTLPPYVDARPTIKTYFKIYSPSKGGRMLSIYESAPDRFNFSQSWGWKSSTLMLDEVALAGADEAVSPIEGHQTRRDGKLRFMVVIGNL